jgi:hypothetical protein
LGELAPVLRFGKVDLLPQRRQLFVDGVVVHVGARAFDLLAALIERRDRVVMKDELLDLAWPSLVADAFGDRTTPTEALRYGTVALFAERARAADRHFVVDANSLATVIDICRSLDGLALTVELAAARLPLLGVAGRARKLDERLRLLGGGCGRRGVPTRQQTLRMALEWSHGLLSPVMAGAARARTRQRARRLGLEHGRRAGFGRGAVGGVVSALCLPGADV